MATAAIIDKFTVISESKNGKRAQIVFRPGQRGNRKPITPRPPAFAPTLRIAAHPDKFLALNDPTLFVLPHHEGFAGATWEQKPDVRFEPYRWTEPPCFLSLSAQKLGIIFTQFMTTNVPTRFELEFKPAPEFAKPIAPQVGPAIPARSTLQITGELVNRRLLNPPELPSWPAADLLTNNVVQVLVDAAGNVISATRLFVPPGSGSPEADRRALELARATRFEPLRDNRTKLTVGTLIFHWPYTDVQKVHDATVRQPVCPI